MDDPLGMVRGVVAGRSGDEPGLVDDMMGLMGMYLIV